MPHISFWTKIPFACTKSHSFRVPSSSWTTWYVGSCISNHVQLIFLRNIFTYTIYIHISTICLFLPWLINTPLYLLIFREWFAKLCFLWITNYLKSLSIVKRYDHRLWALWTYNCDTLSHSTQSPIAKDMQLTTDP